MSYSDSDSSSYGGDYKNFKQITRESEFSFCTILIIITIILMIYFIILEALCYNVWYFSKKRSDSA